MTIDWAVAERPLPGEGLSGDAYVVEPFSGGVLVAVVDALGHGPDAAATSRLAIEALRSCASDTIAGAIRACHQRLRAARGAVMSLASFDARNDTMTWGGVGNVEGFLLRRGTEPSRESLVVRNGVVGFNLPSVRTTVVPVARGDVLVLATDGISDGFVEGSRAGTPQEIADGILARYAKPTDDALVLVAAYVGAAS